MQHDQPLQCSHSSLFEFAEELDGEFIDSSLIVEGVALFDLLRVRHKAVRVCARLAAKR